MSKPIQEVTLMTSDDSSVVLTTHRLLQKKKNDTEEIMLKDIVAYKIYKRRYRFYLVFAILWAVVYVYKNIRYTGHILGWDKAAAQNVFDITISIISLIFYFWTYRKYLRVSDRFHKIEISLKYLRTDSFERFFSRLKTESDQRKEETL
ncbi:MAG TPA: hypothetical protein VIZ28_11690 [Chitinophagaceae bacterium]